MQTKTDGIVISARRYGETSLVTHIITREYGMQGFLVKGVYQKKGTFHPSYFQPLNRVQLVMNYKPNRQLQNLRELQVSPLFQRVPYEIVKTSMAMFLAEVSGKVLKDEAPDDELFEYLQRAIQLLDDWEGSLSLFPQLFLLDLSHYLGFYPHNNYDQSNLYFNLQEGYFQKLHGNQAELLSASESQYLAALLNCSLHHPGEHQIPVNERLSILNHLVDYFRLHTQPFARLQSAQVLRNVLKG
jgi:DNA repair protein RecO (recombination protein O)